MIVQEISPLLVKLTEANTGEPMYIYAANFDAASPAPGGVFNKTYVYTTRHTYVVLETVEEVVEKISAVLTLSTYGGCV